MCSWSFAGSTQVGLAGTGTKYVLLEMFTGITLSIWSCVMTCNLYHIKLLGSILFSSIIIILSHTTSTMLCTSCSQSENRNRVTAVVLQYSWIGWQVSSCCTKIGLTGMKSCNVLLYCRHAGCTTPFECTTLICTGTWTNWNSCLVRCILS